MIWFESWLSGQHPPCAPGSMAWDRSRWGFSWSRCIILTAPGGFLPAVVVLMLGPYLAGLAHEFQTSLENLAYC
jgi:hypothetical protein